MDLVTLVAACALSVEPKIMHALICEQSGGAPWSISVPGRNLPRVHSSCRTPSAKHADRRSRRRSHPRGTGGAAGRPRAATAATFAPCANITLAARRITRLGSVAKLGDGSKPTRSIARSPSITAHGIGRTRFAESVSRHRREGQCTELRHAEGRVSTKLTTRPTHRRRRPMQL